MMGARERTRISLQESSRIKSLARCDFSSYPESYPSQSRAVVGPHGICWARMSRLVTLGTTLTNLLTVGEDTHREDNRARNDALRACGGGCGARTGCAGSEGRQCPAAIYNAVDGRNPPHAGLDALASRGIDTVIKNRRYIHQHPELSNGEFETSAYIAARARALGLEICTPIGKTGVVAVLHGAKPGPTVALRAELDALPYTEEVDLPLCDRANEGGVTGGIQESIPTMTLDALMTA
jgi:hypothetical protein